MDNELLSQAIDGLEDLFFVFADGRELLTWNEALASVTGYSDGELDSMGPVALCTADDSTVVEETIDEVAVGAGQQVVQVHLQTKGGSEIPYELAFTPIERDGEFEAVSVVGRDLTEHRKHEQRLQELAAEIQELSMPVVEIWDGVILTTIVGSLDTRQAERLTEDLLEEIVAAEAAVALIDITGVRAIDTATAQHLFDTINAVNLLGANVVITGISPDIAQTLVQLGVRLEDIETQSSLMEGLRVALTWQGVEFD